jgi:hypothetical protein
MDIQMEDGALALLEGPRLSVRLIASLAPLCQQIQPLSEIPTTLHQSFPLYTFMRISIFYPSVASSITGNACSHRTFSKFSHFLHPSGLSLVERQPASIS